MSMATSMEAVEGEWMENVVILKVISEDIKSRADAQAEKAERSILLNEKLLTEKLTAAVESTGKLIENSVSKRSLLRWTAFFTPNTDNQNIDYACTEIISRFDELVQTASSSSFQLNAFHREVIELESELEMLTPGFEAAPECVHEYLTQAQEHLKGIESGLASLTKFTSANAEEGMRQRKFAQMAAEVSENEKHKARRRWVATILTGGLALPFAIRAECEESKYRDLSYQASSNARKCEDKLHQLQSLRNVGQAKIKTLQDFRKKLIVMKQIANSANIDIRKLKMKTAARSQEYITLKAMATNMSSKAKSLQARVGTMKYADGVDEVRRITGELIEDLQQSDINLIADSTVDSLVTLRRQLLQTSR